MSEGSTVNRHGRVARRLTARHGAAIDTDRQAQTQIGTDIRTDMRTGQTSRPIQEQTDRQTDKICTKTYSRFGGFNSICAMVGTILPHGYNKNTVRLGSHTTSTASPQHTWTGFHPLVHRFSQPLISKNSIPSL